MASSKINLMEIHRITGGAYEDYDQNPNDNIPFEDVQGKYKGFFSSVRVAVVFLSLFFAGYLIYLGTVNISQTITADPSTSYEVKVFDKDISEEAIDVLGVDSFSYAAIIDAGSSGSRVHIFRYGKLGSLQGPLYILPKHKSMKIKPGLSAYVANPDNAGTSLKVLLDFMKEEIPQHSWAHTPIWLKATAGMRLVSKDDSAKILHSVRTLLSSKASPFLFNSVMAGIMPGNEEGAYSWIAYNYLMKLIGPRKPKTG